MHADAGYITSVITERCNLRAIGTPKLDDFVRATRQHVVADKLDVENLLGMSAELLNALRAYFVKDCHSMIVTRRGDDVIVARFDRHGVDACRRRLVHSLRHLGFVRRDIPHRRQFARNFALLASTRKFLLHVIHFRHDSRRKSRLDLFRFRFGVPRGASLRRPLRVRERVSGIISLLHQPCDHSTRGIVLVQRMTQLLPGRL
mmetsp:Transcript_270/g.1003  ORF Transcript_270/g.1003 Transcript_270/m.1003 type:complete len:203 (+) Transcript_270:944-1552(+)